MNDESKELSLILNKFTVSRSSTKKALFELLWFIDKIIQKNRELKKETNRLNRKVSEMESQLNSKINVFNDNEKKLDQEKEDILIRFRKWLENTNILPETEKETELTNPNVDLFSLFSELIALKNEVKIESRNLKKFMDQSQDVYDFINDQGGRDIVTNENDKVVLLELLEIRDRVEAGIDVLNRPSNLFNIEENQHYKQFRENMLSAQKILLKRLDNVLQKQGVVPINAVEKMFNPQMMQAVDVENIPHKSNGIVLEEMRKGFTQNGKMIRIAEVKVNKL